MARGERGGRVLSTPPVRLRFKAWLGVLALALHLLAPLAAAHAAAGPGAGVFICHGSSPTEPPPADSGDHPSLDRHCPCCLSQLDARLLVPDQPEPMGRRALAQELRYNPPVGRVMRSRPVEENRARGPPLFPVSTSV